MLVQFHEEYIRTRSAKIELIWSWFEFGEASNSLCIGSAPVSGTRRVPSHPPLCPPFFSRSTTDVIGPSSQSSTAAAAAIITWFSWRCSAAAPSFRTWPRRNAERRRAPRRTCWKRRCCRTRPWARSRGMRAPAFRCRQRGPFGSTSERELAQIFYRSTEISTHLDAMVHPDLIAPLLSNARVLRLPRKAASKGRPNVGEIATSDLPPFK